MVQKELRKLSLAAILTALSVILDIVFKILVPANQQFGFPFYAIPLVIASMVLGPIYGGLMGFISDAVGFYVFPSGYAYDILFALQAISWGVVPFFLAKRNAQPLSVGLAVLVTHLIATTLSTTANFIGSYLYNHNFNQALAYTLSFLPLRLMMMPVNIIIISYVTYTLNTRLEPLYIEFFSENKKHHIS